MADQADMRPEQARVLRRLADKCLTRNPEEIYCWLVILMILQLMTKFEP